VNNVVDFVHEHGTFLMAGLAVLEGLMVAFLIRRNERMAERLHRAREAAEDAARAAALAAPGGIDPEIVIHLLRTGQPTTLDNVHALMEQRERSEAMRFDGPQ
jgi:hypothetical protein